MTMKLTRRSVLRWGLSLSAAAVARRAPAATGPSAAVAAAPIAIPFDMPGFKEPAFPDRTFAVTDFGARPGGTAMNTRAIAEAIAACARAGGGRVLVPAGVWRTGPIHLKSNVDLHVAEGAELRFSDRFDDYLPVVYMQRGGVRCYNYSPLIYARRCTNVAVTGAGTLNGQGQAWWPWKNRQPGMERLFAMGARQIPVEQRVFGTEADGVRPCFIQPIDCANVLLEDFTLINGPSWNIHPVTCENVTVRRVRVTTMGPNNDGIDPDSCRNVIVEDCFLDTGDDCICLKAGRNEDGWAVGKPCENVVVRRCRTRRGHGGIVFGSEMSAGIRNVLVHDCRFEGTQRGIRIKSLPGRGGAIENLWFRNLVMDGVGAAIHLTLRYARTPNDADAMPVFRNVHVRDLACTNARVAVEMLGLPGGDYIDNVTLDDVAIASVAGLQAEHVRRLRLTRVDLSPSKSPVMRLRDCRDVAIEQSKCPEGADVFLQVDGAASENIRLDEVDLSKAARGVVAGSDVPAGAVVTAPSRL
jgi:polygalacturonase